MTGLKYPLEASNGGLELVTTYPAKVGQAILSALATELEERVLRPEYGLDPQDFTTISDITMILVTIRETIERGLEDLSGVTFDLRGTINDDGMVAVLISYMVAEGTQGQLEVVI